MTIGPQADAVDSHQHITAIQKESYTVLIVEDDKLMRLQLRRAMEQAGYEVVEASNGEKGLTAYTRHHPDIVLLDALMPIMNGFTCCAQLRMLPEGANIPILMITALEDEDSVNHAFAVGATDYITKPINWAVLRQRVRYLLQTSQAMEELRKQTEREHLIRGITQRIRQSLNLEEILNTTVAEVQEFLGCDRVLFYRIWPDGLGKVVAEAVKSGWPITLGQNFTNPFFGASYLQVYRQGQIRAIADVDQAEIEPYYVEFLQQFGVKADLVVPILQGKDFWGLLIAQHCTAPREWTSAEIELLQQLVDQVGIALAQAHHLDTIRESEERFRQLAENIQEVFFLATPERLLYMSPAYEEIWGRSCESIYQGLTSWLDLIHPEDRDRLQKAWNEQIKTGQAVNEESRIIRADGRVGWIRARTFPVRSQNGEIYRISGIAEDITERKQSEIEIKKALEKEQALSNERLRLANHIRLLLESTGEGIYGIDLQGCCTFINQAALEMLGYQLDEVMGKNMHSLIHHTRNNGKLYPSSECPIFATLKNRHGCRIEDEVLWRKDRTYFPAEYSSYPVIEEDIIQGTVVMFTDITQRKQTEAELRNALEREKELSDLKSRFVTMTSHEFRTPLSTILSSAELLEHYSNKWTEEKKHQHLHRIQIAVKTMTQLLNDVLIFGKAEAGKLEFNPASINLEEFCLNLLEDLQFTAGTQYAISFFSQGSCSELYMDEKLLQHILTNLLSNAVKYSPQGGTINFELFCNPNEVIFRIQDQGLGIPPDEQTNLFNPFERGSNVGQISGTGLGLAIVKNCVDLHGGTILVESEVGVGTTFTVTLPAPILNNQTPA